MQIWKYQIRVEDTTTVEMPARSRVLSMQVQDGYPCVWAMVNPDAPRVTRTFHVVCTGDEVRGYVGEFVGTFQLAGGVFVGHLFVESEE